MTQQIEDLFRKFDHDIFALNHRQMSRFFASPSIIYIENWQRVLRSRGSLTSLIELYWCRLKSAGACSSECSELNIEALPGMAFLTEAAVEFFDDCGDSLGAGELRMWMNLSDCGPRIELTEYTKLPMCLTPDDLARPRLLH